MGLLSRLGIGAASVEPSLHAPRTVAGSSVPVRVTVQGGSDGQHADALVVRLVTEVTTGDGTELQTLAETTLATDRSVEPGVQQEFAGELDVPVWAPTTQAGAEVLLSASLSMGWSRDPTGRTSVDIDVGPRLDRALAALAGIGIGIDRTRPIDATTAAQGTGAPAADREVPVVQQFDCHPQSGAYVGRIHRLTVVVVPAPGVLTLHLSTDMDPDTVYGPTDAYERFSTVEVTDQSVPDLQRTFERALGTGSTSRPSRGL
jgi:sporulation-control protein spo0M